MSVLPADWRERPCPICAPFEEPHAPFPMVSTFEKREECCIALDGDFAGLPCWYVLCKEAERTAAVEERVILALAIRSGG